MSVARRSKSSFCPFFLKEKESKRESDACRQPSGQGRAHFRLPVHGADWGENGLTGPVDCATLLDGIVLTRNNDDKEVKP